MKTIQNETQGKKRKDLWSSLCFCLLRSSVLQTLASFISDSQVHVLKLRESFSLHFSDLSLCQTLDSLPKQGLEQSYWLPYSFSISQRRLSSIAWYPVSWKLLFHVIHSVFWLFQHQVSFSPAVSPSSLFPTLMMSPLIVNAGTVYALHLTGWIYAIPPLTVPFIFSPI